MHLLLLNESSLTEKKIFLILEVRLDVKAFHVDKILMPFLKCTLCAWQFVHVCMFMGGARMCTVCAFYLYYLFIHG